MAQWGKTAGSPDFNELQDNYQTVQERGRSARLADQKYTENMAVGKPKQERKNWLERAVEAWNKFWERSEGN